MEDKKIYMKCSCGAWDIGTLRKEESAEELLKRTVCYSCREKGKFHQKTYDDWVWR